jgi:hypothetical protein
MSMDKTIVGLFGAMAALASLDTAQAATEAAPKPTEITAAKSFAELLDPIPNALTRLRAADEAAANAPKADEGVQVAQFFYHHHHHHHHRWYHHHHHHRWYPPRGYYHHHHHHHHRYWRGY